MNAQGAKLSNIRTFCYTLLTPFKNYSHIQLNLVIFSYVLLRSVTCCYVKLLSDTLRSVTFSHIQSRPLIFSYVLIRSVTFRYVTFRYITFSNFQTHPVTSCYVQLHFLMSNWIQFRSVTFWKSVTVKNCPLRYVTVKLLSVKTHNGP